MNRIPLLILIGLIAVAPVKAQELLTLDEAIQRALKRNYDVRVADVNAQIAAANNTLGNAGFLPVIGATTSISDGVNDSRIVTAAGQETNRTGANTLSYSAGLTGSYTLFAAGRAYIVRQQLGRIEALGGVQFRAQVQSTVSAVIQTYAAAVNAQQQTVALDTAIALARARMDLSKAKFDIGTAAKVDYLQARVDYNASRSLRLDQNATRIASLASLNLLIGEDAEDEYAVQDSLGLNLALEPTDKARLEELSLPLDIARRNVAISRLDARIARTAYYTGITVNAGYGYSHVQSDAGLTLTNRGFGPTVGGGVTIPVFQAGNVRRLVRVANLQTLSSEIAYERQGAELSRQYRTAWSAYRNAIAAYRLEEENRGYAKENLDIQQARFRVGVATSIEIREAENSYVATLARLYGAAYNVKVNETRVLEIESRLAE